MKLQSKRKKAVVIASIVVAVVLVIALIALLVVPAIIKSLNKIDPYIKVSINPKNSYYVGEKFDPTGLQIQIVTGDNDTSYFVRYPDADLKITGFDSSVAKESLAVTITYKGMSTTMNVTIKEYPDPAPTLQSIRLSDNFYATPHPLDYWNDFGPRRTNINIILTYSDGSEKEIPLKGEHCFNVTRPLAGAGTTQFTIKYSEGGKVFEETITVTITE